MMYDRKTTKIDSAEMARLYAIRYGYNDPATQMFRQRAKREARIELAKEIATVALWLGGGYLWMLLTWSTH